MGIVAFEQQSIEHLKADEPVAWRMLPYTLPAA